MSDNHRELVGHDNPLGSYPAPVVPIIRLNGSLAAVYASGASAEVVQLSPRKKFVRHNRSLKKALRRFDHRRYRLFALGRDLVEFYPIKSERAYLGKLLERPAILSKDPFFRLSIAKGSAQKHLIVPEMISCLEDLKEEPEHFVDLWYLSQCEGLRNDPDFQASWRLPTDWRELLIREHSPVRGLEQMPHWVKRIPSYFHTPSHSKWIQVGRVAGIKEKRRKRIIQSTVTRKLAQKSGMSPSQVRMFLEELRALAIRELKGAGEFTIPHFGTLVLSHPRGKEAEITLLPGMKMKGGSSKRARYTKAQRKSFKGR